LRKFPFTEVRWIWMDGRLVDFEEANVHVLSHSIHYASGVFEGLRSYDTPAGPAVFRLRPHMQRLLDSCKVVRMELSLTLDELCGAVLDTLRANHLKASYIRPFAFRGFGSMMVNPRLSPVVVSVAAWPPKPGGYLGEKAASGIDACVSSWRRVPSSSMPSNVKASANYLNSQLIKMQAELDGYDEGLALDEGGNVSEGSAENVFLVKDGVLYTPPASSSLLPGITRDCLMTLAGDLGIKVREQTVPRGVLYIADEVFLTGTSAEVAPVRSVDRIVIGDGRPGPVTQRLAAELLGIACGELPDRHGWLTPVSETGEAVTAG
jgi:branched-chain amino acid aminotransferase